MRYQTFKRVRRQALKSVWVKTVSIYQMLSHYWDSEADMYPGSDLCNIMFFFVSLYQITMLIAAYMFI